MSQAQATIAGQERIATWHVYVGLFLVCLATLIYELLLTRIFSVTLWYHFAFMAISIAVFGMTVGAIAVYLQPKFFTGECTNKHLAYSAFCFAIAIAVSFWAQSEINALPYYSALGLTSVAIVYIIASIPFIFSGICVCLALTRFSTQVSKLYAADLLGGAVGCLLLPLGLSVLGGPSLVLAIATIVALASFFYALAYNKQTATTCAIVAFALAAICMLNTQYSFVRIRYSQGVREAPAKYEKWNTFSRIRVSDMSSDPFGWGFNTQMPGGQKIEQMKLDIDSKAATVLTRYTGNLNQLDYLKYDISNAVHYIRHDGDILIVGVGGGRDILSAFLFKQKSITGVELNPVTIDVLKRIYGNFTGHLDRDPRVTLVNDEARSYIARSKQKYDLIELSLIDTWAATSAGAFSLSENALYTEEAWKIMLTHLKADGIISCSRWYAPNRPEELYRLISLAASALRSAGVKDPSQHIVALYAPHQDKPYSVATLLVNLSPFKADELQCLEQLAKDKDFSIIVSPDGTSDNNLKQLLGDNPAQFIQNYRFNISAPVDDKPFFFQMARFSDWRNANLLQASRNYGNLVAIATLVILLLTVTVLTSICIIVPLALTAKTFDMTQAWPLLVYFCAIGCAYMFVEVSQIQRLSIFLGHPSYSLIVVLFTLLFASGSGSFLTSGISRVRDYRTCLLAVPMVLAAIGVVSPILTHSFEGAPTPVRIGIAVFLVALMGLTMGTAFPIGMKLAAKKFTALTPWFWGLNGATSVLASVLAMVLSIAFSITTAFWAGIGFYLLALTMCVLATRDKSYV